VRPWEANEKAKLTEVLGRVFDLQKQYGKTPAQLENLVAGFCWALQGYPVDMVVDGIRQYILKKNDMPAPADIRHIIDPVKEPWRPDRSYYEKLREQLKMYGQYALNPDEVAYIQDYEDHMQNERLAK
jgi:hypothetical protein